MATKELRTIRLSEVRRLTGLSRSSIYRLEALGRFPAHIKLSDRASAWLASEVERWIETRVAAAREAA